MNFHTFLKVVQDEPIHTESSDGRSPTRIISDAPLRWPYIGACQSQPNPSFGTQLTPRNLYKSYGLGSPGPSDEPIALVHPKWRAKATASPDPPDEPVAHVHSRTLLYVHIKLYKSYGRSPSSDFLIKLLFLQYSTHTNESFIFFGTKINEVT